MKTCSKCGENKPRSEFYARPEAADGLRSKCKLCFRAYMKARIKQYRRTARGKATKRASRHEYRARYPERQAAMKAVENALRKGLMVSMPCSVCGTGIDVHAHHANYARQLDVKWLCGFHHKAVHVRR